MPALSGQQRPWPPLAIATEGAAVILLAVPVVRVATKARPLRKIVPQRRVDDLDRSLNERIVGFANAVTNQFEEPSVEDCSALYN